MRRRIVIGPDTRLIRLGGKPPRVTGTLIAVHIALFVVYAFADGPAWVREHVALSTGQALGRFELWQPLTAMWLHLEPRAILNNMLMLWVFGGALERWWGRRRYLLFYVGTGVAGGVAAMLGGLAWPTHLVAGAGGSATALLVAFALLYPDHLVHFYGVLPLKGRWLALVGAVFLLLGAAMGRRYLELFLAAGGALAALAYLELPRRLRRRHPRGRRKKRDGPRLLN